MLQSFFCLDSNSPPKANAGGDHIVELPVDVLVLNGSQSRDDLAIAKWLWTREPTSLAIGSIIAGTDTSPVLMVSIGDFTRNQYILILPCE